MDATKLLERMMVSLTLLWTTAQICVECEASAARCSDACESSFCKNAAYMAKANHAIMNREEEDWRAISVEHVILLEPAKSFKWLS
jgi:hypothetical protein